MKFSEMFSSSDKTSYGRFISAMATVFLLGWVTALLCRAYAMPQITVAELKTAIPDIPASWLAIVMGPYGLSKGLEVAGLVFGKGNDGSDQSAK